MLLGFIDKLQTVTVRIAGLRGVISRVVMQLRAGFVDGHSTGFQCGLKCLLHLILTVCDKSDMHSLRCRHALPQPEKDAAIRAKPPEVRMARRPVFPS